jgi:hypothetical protein
MLDWQKQHIIRIKEEHNWSWVDIGIAVDLSPDTVRKYYSKYSLEKEIGPKPKLPRKRLLGGINAIKVIKKRMEEPKLSFRKMAAWIRAELGVQISHSSVKDFFDQQASMTSKAPKRPILEEET